MTAPPTPDQPAGIRHGDGMAVPKVVELRIEARFADGSRTLMSYSPEPGETLRVQVENVDEPEAEGGIMPLDAARPPRIYPGRRASGRHLIDVRGVTGYLIEHLVRQTPPTH